MGTPEFAVPILKSINNSKHKLLCVYTQPPKKKFRGQKIISSPVQEFAEKYKIPFRCPDNLTTEKEYNFIKELKPNIVIVVAYGKIIPKNILNLEMLGDVCTDERSSLICSTPVLEAASISRKSILFPS